MCEILGVSRCNYYSAKLKMTGIVQPQSLRKDACLVLRWVNARTQT